MSIRATYPTWQEAIRAIATFWNANFNGTNRLIRGVDTTDDAIIDSATTGLVLKDTAGVYWRVSVSTTGVLTTTNIGSIKP
ncbi:MAG: hypothetical protein ACYCZJ_13195 [Sulfuriferula sp.]